MKEIQGDNFFSCKGKFAGTLNRAATPGGMIIRDVLIAVEAKVPWKQKKMMNLKVTCFGDSVDVVERLKTGEKVKVEGIMEQTGKKEKEELKLIATKIEKEK